MLVVLAISRSLVLAVAARVGEAAAVDGATVGDVGGTGVSDIAAEGGAGAVVGIAEAGVIGAAGEFETAAGGVVEVAFEQPARTSPIAKIDARRRPIKIGLRVNCFLWFLDLKCDIILLYINIDFSY